MLVLTNTLPVRTVRPDPSLTDSVLVYLIDFITTTVLYDNMEVTVNKVKFGRYFIDLFVMCALNAKKAVIFWYKKIFPNIKPDAQTSSLITVNDCNAFLCSTSHKENRTVRPVRMCVYSKKHLSSDYFWYKSVDENCFF